MTGHIYQDNNQDDNMSDENRPSDQTNQDLPPEKPEEFFGEMDDAKRTGSKSCCTIWTLGLLLMVLLGFGLWLIFAV